MLESLEFREEKNSLGNDSLSYGKFAFSRLEKGQGLTVANTLRRVLLYELPAVGITSVLIKSSHTSNSSITGQLHDASRQTLKENLDSFDSAKPDNGVKPTVQNSQIAGIASNSDIKWPVITAQEQSAHFGASKGTPGYAAAKHNIDLSKDPNTLPGNEISFLSEETSSHHEFSTLPGIKESVLEILFNLKSVVFENIFPYSSIQKGTLSLSLLKEVNPSANSALRANPTSEKTPTTLRFAPHSEFQDFKIKASQLVLPSEIRVIHPEQILATLVQPHTNFELEFTIEKITQSDLTSTSSFSGRAPNRSTKNRRILPIDGTIFPVKKVNYTIEQDSFGKEIVFFEIWTNGGLQPRDAIFQAIEKVMKLFQTFQE